MTASSCRHNAAVKLPLWYTHTLFVIFCTIANSCHRTSVITVLTPPHVARVRRHSVKLARSARYNPSNYATSNLSTSSLAIPLIFFFLMICPPPTFTLSPSTPFFFFFLKDPPPTKIPPFPSHAVFRF